MLHHLFYTEQAGHRQLASLIAKVREKYGHLKINYPLEHYSFKKIEINFRRKILPPAFRGISGTKCTPPFNCL